MTSTKTLPAIIQKAAEEGTFTALASTFGDYVDLQGDRVDRHGFDRTIEEWRALGEWPPLFYMHVYSDPKAEVGRVTFMDAIDTGLLVRGKLDLANVMARAVHERMMAGDLRALSIGYTARREEDGSQGERVLLDIDLHEISIVAHPANEEALVLDVKRRERRPAPAPSRTVAALADVEADLATRFPVELVKAVFGRDPAAAGARAERERRERGPATKVALADQATAMKAAGLHPDLVDTVFGAPTAKERAAADVEREAAERMAKTRAAIEERSRHLAVRPMPATDSRFTEPRDEVPTPKSGERFRVPVYATEAGHYEVDVDSHMRERDAAGQLERMLDELPKAPPRARLVRRRP
jgi:hypothetical protein